MTTDRKPDETTVVVWVCDNCHRVEPVDTQHRGYPKAWWCGFTASGAPKCHCGGGYIKQEKK